MGDRLSKLDPRNRSASIVPNRIRRSYLLKFTAVVVGIAVVTLLFGLLFQSSIADSLTADQENRIAGVAEDQATSIEAWVEKNEESTRLISTRDVFREGSDREISEALAAEFLSLDDEHQAIHYVNTDSGEILDSSESTATGSSLDDRGYEWLVTGDNTQLTFSDSNDVIVSKITVVDGTGRLAFASPVPESENRALVIPVDVATLSQQFRNPIEGSNTQIVSAAGEIQVDNDIDTLDTVYDRQSVLRRGLHGAVGTVQFEELVIGYAPVTAIDQPTSTADVGWVVLVHVPASNAFALQSQISQNIFIIIGVGLLGFVLVGATIGRNTVAALEDLSERAERLRDGDLDTDLESSRIDEIGRLYASFGEMRNALDRRITEATQSEQEATDAKQDAERARREAEQFTNHLRETASQYSDSMGQAASGDLTQRLDPDERSEAMAEIATAFNEMLNELEATVVELQTFADDVAAETETVTARTGTINEASTDVSNSIQEIADGADDQRRQLTTVIDEMSQLSATVEEIASQASAVAETSRETLDVGESGRQSAEDAIEEMREIERLTQETVTAVEDLESRFDEIGEIVELITTIADQTDILALNASVEAARAGNGGGGGEHAGDGFAVVAEEVKSLAEETKASAGDIEAQIETIREQMEATVADVQQTRTRIAEGTETVNETVGAFEEVVDNVQRTNDGIQEISEATDDQAQSTQEAVAMIEDVEKISRETSNQTESVTAAAEQQAASLDEVQDSIRQLATQAGDLQTQLDAFDVDQ